MSSDPKKGGGGPSTPDGREGDPGSLDSELESLADLLDGSFFEARGELLGAPPPPLPPPPEEIITSAPRPTRAASPHAPVLPPVSPAPTHAPTDEEIFGTGVGSAEFDAAFERSVSGEHPLPTAPAEPDEPREPDDGFSESTRIAAVDDALLRQARSAGPAPAGPPPRRSPAIVRRDKLPARGHAAGGEEYEGEDSTRIADPGYNLAQLESADDDEPEPPEVSVELDESFYEGIEIGTAPEDAPPAAEPARPVSPLLTGPRRVTRNVVRRPTGGIAAHPVGSGTGSHAVPRAEPAPPPATPPLAAPPEDPLSATGEFRNRRRAESISAPPTGVSPRPPLSADLIEDDVAAHAASDEDSVGSSPLIDVLADFDRVEASVSEPGAMPSELSADLEGGLDGLEGFEGLAGLGELEDAEIEELPVSPVEDSSTPPVRARAALDDDFDDFGEREQTIVGRGVAAPLDETRLSIDVSGEHDVTSVAVLAGAGEPATELGVAGARLALPAELAPDLDSIETESIAELAELEQELDRRGAEAEAVAALRYYAGAAAERLGDVDRAREHYDEAAQGDVALAPAARALRRLLFARGEHAEALRHLDHELELASTGERPALAAHRADLLLAVGEQDLARVAYGELIDSRPDDVRSLLAQLELAYSDDRDDELREVLAALARHLRDPALVAALAVLRARFLEAAGRDVEAAAAFAEAITDDDAELSDSGRLAILGLMRLALRGGRPADAALQRGRFLGASLDPLLDGAARRRAARAALAAGDTEAALAGLEGVAASRDPLLLETLADAQLSTGRPADAVATLRAWADAEPSATRRAEVLHRVAVVARGALDDHAAAADALRAAAAADPADADTAAELAAGDLEAAVALERAAAAADPARAAGAHLAAARLLAAADRGAEAVAELEAARAAAPESAIVVDALARAYADAVRPDLLATLWSEAAVTSCGPGAARERAARAAEERAAHGGHPDELGAAEAAWRAVLELEPGSTAAHAAMVRLAAARGDAIAAAAALGEARTQSRDPLRASMLAVQRAALLAGAGDRAAAAEVLDEALAADPADARIVDRRAVLAASAPEGPAWGDVAAARAAHADAIPDGPARDAARARAAALLESEGDLGRAAELLAPAMAARPEFTGGAVLLERLYRRLGDAAGLAARLEQELAASPPNDPLRAARLVRLAEVLLEGTGEPARAASLYREALAIRPDDPIVRDGFTRVATAANEIAPLADLALADLHAAEARGDLAGKVAAYETLAHIDGDLRGDPSSATLAWEAAATLDPGHLQALRALERTYLGGDGARAGELATVYARLGAALADTPSDAIPVLLESARLHERLGQPQAALADHREALALGESRMSLFRLESRARDTAQLEDMAELAERVGATFAGDARSQAAFLTRAGEHLADLGRADEALQRFRAAADLLPGFVPALRGWRRVALTAQPEPRWDEVVEACEREAATARGDSERARLLHLAGVAAMDRAGDPERAARALRHVLALDPRHHDAFQRLRQLYAAAGAPHAKELAELLAARVDIEPHPGRLVELHATLAALYRDSLGDLDRAKAHLRAVLQRDPRNLAAVTALSDIAWGQGQWAEAADALIARARLEKDDAALKEIFFRLGVIYDEKLPDRRWAIKSFERVLSLDPDDARALEHLSQLSVAGGDWRVALGATERLVSLDSDPRQKVTHLLRIARVFEEGHQDRKRAEDALRRATDVDPTSSEALAALAAFYGRARDTASLRVNLDRIASLMRHRLEKDAFDGVAHRVLARALVTRAQAGVAGSLEAGRCASELAVALGAAEDADRVLAAEAAQLVPSATGLGLLHIDELLFHPTIPNGFRQLFRLLYDTLSKRFPADLRRAGVGKGDRLPRTGHPVRDVLARVAGELGVRDFEVYVSSARPGALAVELTDPISIVIGAGIAAAGPAELRFAAARTMKLAMSYMAVPAALGPEELGVLLAAIIRQHDPNFSPPGITLPAVAAEARDLGRRIPKRLRDEMRSFATEISGVAFDHHAFWLGIQHTGNRAGLIASGSVLAGASVLAQAAGHRDLLSSRGDPQIEELLRFAVSNEHCEVRAALGG